MSEQRDRAWEKIFEVTAKMIKRACQDFTTTGSREVRILCKQDMRESRPQVFIDRNLFLLPVRNGVYKIIQGEGYKEVENTKYKAKGIAPKKQNLQISSARI